MFITKSIPKENQLSLVPKEKQSIPKENRGVEFHL